jgi:hypothetical protein
VTKERETEVGIGADAIQAMFCGIGDLIDSVTAQVGEFLQFEVAPCLLEWIEVRCVARELLNRQPITMAGVQSKGESP